SIAVLRRDAGSAIAVGAPGLLDAGYVEVISRVDVTAPAATVPTTLYGFSLNENFGYALVAADFNGDGLPELAIGAPGLADGGSNQGGVWVHLGISGAAIISTSAQFISNPLSAAEQNESRFGASLGSADVDGDGKTDLIIGAPGAAKTFVYRGGTGMIVSGTPVFPNYPAGGAAV